MRRAITMLALSACLLGPAAGCSTAYEDLCDRICECQGCVDWELENCLIDAEYYVAYDEIYGCVEEGAAVAECRIENGRCEGRQWLSATYEDCPDVQDTYDICIDKGSGIIDYDGDG